MTKRVNDGTIKKDWGLSCPRVINQGLKTRRTKNKKMSL